MDSESKEWCEEFAKSVDELSLSFEAMVNLWGCSFTTARAWMAGRSAPAKPYQKIILHDIEQMKNGEWRYK